MSRDDQAVAVNIDFDGNTAYGTMKNLVDALNAKLQGSSLRISNSGATLLVTTTNGRARTIDVGVFAPLGFTAPQRGYVVRPSLSGAATFDLPFSARSRTADSGLAVNSRIAITMPDITKPKEVRSSIRMLRQRSKSD